MLDANETTRQNKIANDLKGYIEADQVENARKLLGRHGELARKLACDWPIGGYSMMDRAESPEMQHLLMRHGAMPKQPKVADLPTFPPHLLVDTLPLHAPPVILM